MTELHDHELIERYQVDPPAEPDEDGWIATAAYEAVYRTTTFVTDVDDNPLAVEPNTVVVRSVHRVPPDSPRLERLRWERENGIITDLEGNYIDE